MIKIFITAATLLASSTVLAGEGEICKSLKGETTLQYMEKGLSNERLYVCPSLGDVTIPQIYKKGWKVIIINVSILNVNTPNPLSFPQILIEKTQ